MRIASALIFTLLIVPPCGTFAADGDLDVTFGVGGKVTTDFFGDESIAAMAIQPDGKILVAGRSSQAGSGDKSILVRYNTDGSVDSTFGTDGQVSIDFDIREGFRALAIQPDGKIVVIGDGSRGGILTRYTSEGALDTTFGVAGVVPAFYPALYIWGEGAVAIQSDGKILVVASAPDCGGGSASLARYNSDGTPDRTFGRGGTVFLDYSEYDSFISTLALQPDGKIIAAGGTSFFTRAFSDFRLARHNTTGELDRTFGSGGIVKTDVFSAYESAAVYTHESARGVALQPDGKIVAAGRASVANIAPSLSYANAGLPLVRYNTDGSLDQAFGVGGKVVTAGGEAFSLAVQSDGKILAAARFTFANVQSQFGVARYNRDGQLDVTFGVGGIVTTDFGGVSASASAIAIQPDGKIVAAGTTMSGTSDFAMARYNSGGSLFIDGIQFGPACVQAGGVLTAAFLSSSDVPEEAYFDVRFRSPASNQDQVALNWQRGRSAQHTVPASTIPGVWRVTGVRPHRSVNQMGDDFLPLSATLTVSPTVCADPN